MTWMVQAEFDGKKMTDDELRAFFVLLAVAANDTTRHASAHAIYTLSKFPDTARPAGRRRRRAGSTPPSRRCCAGRRRCCTCAAPPPRTSPSATRRSRPATRSCSGTARATATRTSSTTRSRSTSCVTPTRTSRSAAAARTSASARRWPAPCCKSLLTEVYTRIPDISAPEPNFQVANFINGINSLPATWTPERA